METKQTNNSLTFNQHPHFIFQGTDGNEVIRITPTLFYYKGEQIDDAGEVYKLFKEFLEKNISYGN